MTRSVRVSIRIFFAVGILLGILGGILLLTAPKAEAQEGLSPEVVVAAAIAKQYGVPAEQAWIVPGIGWCSPGRFDTQAYTIGADSVPRLGAFGIREDRFGGPNGTDSTGAMWASREDMYVFDTNVLFGLLAMAEASAAGVYDNVGAVADLGCSSVRHLDFRPSPQAAVESIKAAITHRRAFGTPEEFHQSALSYCRGVIAVGAMDKCTLLGGYPSPDALADPAKNMIIAQALLPQHFPGTDTSSQFSCLVSLWTRESGMDQYKMNYAGSGATGIPQALPGSKMASAGADWAWNPATQIVWGLGYIGDRYGTPCAADSFQWSRGWY